MFKIVLILLIELLIVNLFTNPSLYKIVGVGVEIDVVTGTKTTEDSLNINCVELNSING